MFPILYVILFTNISHSTKELLNPVSEQKLMGEVSDEEIFQSIMDMHKAEQIVEVNRGCDVDDEVLNKKSTHKEALTATFTPQKLCC